MNLNHGLWRFRVWKRTGEGPTDIIREASVMSSSGIRAQITPETDTREVSLNNRGLPRSAELGIRSLDAVQWQVFDEDAQVWVSLAYGQVRQGGNLRNVLGETMILRSLYLRLSRVTLPRTFATPQQAAHRTVRAAIQALIASGKLGTPPLIEYDEALCPDLGFDASPILNSNQLPASKLLELVIADGKRFGVDVRMGVTPDRTFFCRAAKTDVLVVPAGDLSALVHKEPVAEDPVTSVLWLVKQLPDERWVTHISRLPSADEYGDWEKTSEVDASIPGLRVASMTVGGNGVAANALPFTDTSLDGLLELLTDGDTTSATAYALAPDEHATLKVIFTLTEPSDYIVISADWIRADITSPGDTTCTLVLNTNDAADGRLITLYAFNYGSFAVSGKAGWMQDVLYAGNTPWPAGTTLTFRAPPDTAQTVGNRTSYIHFFEVAGYTPNAAVLDPLAAYHESLPAEEPADIALRTLRRPDEFTGRVRAGDYERPVEVFEYRMSGPEGFELGVLTGQSEEPEDIARAQLIRARDADAKISALTAPTRRQM